ncbi:response regulator transcription factor [Nocardioides sp. YIM 152315]|uniref:response regulator transcription factor n=1 Tax=Nocardioides sp. YIM 152315 TaxID=3031760 RepID=UPI0023DCC0FC|nr:response regulator transcription factor [Nocardioides sp. YIM 152315]MDF1606229.1 response regulator transcription factor [Nocardioides sp. YIM 152315]
MPGRPLRLAIASADKTVAQGLRTMLCGRSDRVVVVDDGPADVVLYDADRPVVEDVGALMERTGALGLAPLRDGVDQIVSLVEAAAGYGLAEPAGAALSEREEQVLALIAQGLTNQEIADRVFISINSVKTYIRSAYRKIGVSSRSQAVAWGLRKGVLPPPR